MVAAVAHLRVARVEPQVDRVEPQVDRVEPQVERVEPQVDRVTRVEPQVDPVTQVERVERAPRDLPRVSPGDHVRMSFDPKTSQD